MVLGGSETLSKKLLPATDFEQPKVILNKFLPS